MKKRRLITLQIITATILALSLVLGGAAANPKGYFAAGAAKAEKPPPPSESPLEAEAGEWSAAETITRWIVKFSDPAQLALFRSSGGSPDLLNRLAEAASLGLAEPLELSFVREMSGEAIVVASAEGLPVEAANEVAKRLQALEGVAYAEPDRLRQAAQTPNDTHYSKQWALFPPAAGNYGLNAPAAWDITRGSASVIVAVIDTGITNHADLAGRVLPGYDFISDAWMANDGDGRDSDASDAGDWVSANACGLGSPARSSSWHGTHVAGSIAAAANNGMGVAGVNWASPILPVRVLGRCGGYTSDIVDGMRWAAGFAVPGAPGNPHKAQVLNLSLGGSGPCSISEQNAISAITAAGSTVVVAAGNSNSDASGFSPANCQGVITVAATERNGNRAYYSNYGSLVELSAPGGDVSTGSAGGILSTINAGLQTPTTDSYAYYQGTSMAAPHAAGVASLIYSLIPAVTPTQVVQIMQNTVTGFPAGSTCNSLLCGSGIVNAAQALGGLPRLTSLSPASASVGSALTLAVNGANFDATSRVLWNGAERATTFISSSQLSIQVSAADIPTAGFYRIAVRRNHPLYGSLTTPSVNFLVGLNRSFYLTKVYASSSSPAEVLPGVIQNGDFEAGSAGWQTYSSTGEAVIRNSFPPPVAAYNGSYAAVLGGSDSQTSFIQQTVWVDPDKPYLVYYHWIESADYCGYDYASLRVDSFLVNRYSLCLTNNTGSWVKQAFNLAAYAGKAVFLRLGVENDSSLVSSLFVDGVRFSAAP